MAHRAVVPIAAQLASIDFASHPVGVGMGQGATAITKLMTGRTGFALGEGELGRVMAEIGPFPGVFFMLFRLFLALMLLKQALAEACKREPLALFFAPLALPALFLDTLEQPTEQGFMVIGLAFMLAALKMSKREIAPSPSRSVQRRPLRYSMPR